MAQSYDMDARVFDSLEHPANLIRKQLVGDRVHVTEVFTGKVRAEIQAAMDARKADLEAAGAERFHRTAIGRNAPCPCGSGLKLKKCCIGRAQFATGLSPSG